MLRTIPESLSVMVREVLSNGNAGPSVMVPTTLIVSLPSLVTESSITSRSKEADPRRLPGGMTILTCDAAVKSSPLVAVLRRPAWPPMVAVTTVRVWEETCAPAGKAAVTVTRRVPAFSSRVLCVPVVSGSASTVNISRCGVSSASVRARVRWSASAVNPAGTEAATVRDSAGSSKRSAVPDRLKAAEARFVPAGMTAVKSATT